MTSMSETTKSHKAHAPKSVNFAVFICSSMFGITLGFVALAVFFFYGYGRLKTSEAKVLDGAAPLA